MKTTNDFRDPIPHLYTVEIKDEGVDVGSTIETMKGPALIVRKTGWVAEVILERDMKHPNPKGVSER